MRPRRCALLLSLTSAVILLSGSGSPWAAKDFKAWTRDDALSLMTDSPWAKPMPMPAIGRPSVMVMEPGSNVNSPPAASLGNPANTTSGANMSIPSIGGANGPAQSADTRSPRAPTQSGISANTGAPEPPAVVTVIWASAAPVRLAVLKLRSAENPPADAEISHALAPRSHYVIAVVGLPAPEPGSDPKALAVGAFLAVKGKPPLQAADSDYRKIGSSDVYFFRFERASLPLSAADHDVQFRTTIGRVQIKKKFDLGEMQYQGRLAL